MASIPIAEKPHAVVVPYPTQGHINPFLKLAKLLYHKGFHITFVNTEFNHKRLLKSRGPNSLQGLPHFQFETIPDGLPLTDTDTTQHIPSLSDSTRKNCSVPFRNLLVKINDTESSNVPPVTCIVSDGVMSFTLKASQEFGIPNVLFWTFSACGFLGFVKCRELIDKGISPLKDASYLTNGYLDSLIEWIPGKKSTIRLRDIPSFIRATDPKDIMLDFLKGEAENAPKGSAIILLTFDDLEQDVLDAVSPKFPINLYTIGPLHLLLDQIPNNHVLNSIESNLWKEECECLQCLDSKETNSVLYVNFGSITVMTTENLIELAWGLANSKQNFLWIVRTDLVMGDTAILPPEFKDETKERGLNAGWCPQEKVLKHPSVGGFLTHCGWNSMMESISNGVPMLCWPFFSDQPTNCMYACTEWGIGMEIDSDVKRDDVEKLVRELMEGDKGKEMKSTAMEWKKKAEVAVGSHGSSYMNLDKLVDQVLLSKR